MPFGSEGPQSGIGLPPAGGGFRATLFHCGALWRLNELGYLQKLDRVSRVSGGSITAGLLARIRTRLNPFTQAEQESLINWGYAVCDAAVRTYFNLHASPPSGWPYPTYALEQANWRKTSRSNQ